MFDSELILTNTYSSLGEELKRTAHPLGEDLMESFGINQKMIISYSSLLANVTAFKNTLPDYPWENRANMEVLHYNKLRYSLSHSFAENWFYKSEWIENTRRVVALSSDCISCISLYIREGQIMVSVYFRSSHFNNLLPVDLSFLTLLPVYFMEDLQGSIETFEIPHELPEIDVVNFDFSFGNLHETLVEGVQHEDFPIV